MEATTAGAETDALIPRQQARLRHREILRCAGAMGRPVVGRPGCSRISLTTFSVTKASTVRPPPQGQGAHFLAEDAHQQLRPRDPDGYLPRGDLAHAVRQSTSRARAFELRTSGELSGGTENVYSSALRSRGGAALPDASRRNWLSRDAQGGSGSHRFYARRVRRPVLSTMLDVDPDGRR